MTGHPFEALAPYFYQIGYVVRDLAAAEQWFQRTLGVPHFVRVDNVLVGPKCTYRGRPADSSMDLSLGFAKDTQIELIQPVRGPSLYTEFLEQRGPGLHHIAFVVPDFDETVARLESEGLEAVTQGLLQGRTRFAYFDCEAEGASIVEILGFTPATWEFMEQIKSGTSPS